MNRKDITGLITDDDAVAPVIAVILMVAITVILAAIISSFVIGVGSKQSTAPQASMKFDYDRSAKTVTVQHQGGDELEASSLAVKETGSTDGITVNSGQETFVSGDVVASGSYEPGETIRLIWRGPQSKDNAVLGRSKAPT